MLSELDLNLLSHVENGTVAARAKHLLVKRSLATLALGPESGELLFQDGELSDALLVDGALASLAVRADGVSVFRQGELGQLNTGIVMHQGQAKVRPILWLYS